MTQFSYAYSLLKDFNGSITDLKNIKSDLLKNSNDATVFVANWDSARGSETLSPTSGARYELANAFMLGYDYGHPKILSDYYFDKSTQYDDGVKDTSDTKVPYVDMNKACAISKDPTQMAYGDWNCQQRWTSIRGMIRFHNAVNGTKVTNWQENGDNNIAFDRAADGSSTAKGFMAINNTLQDHDVDYTTTLPDDTYCDVYASRDCSKKVKVSGGHIKTTIGKRSAIALYQGAAAESDPDKGKYDPQYRDSPNSTLIADKTLTVYYKPKQSGSAPTLHYQKADGSEQNLAMKAVDASDSTDANGWYSVNLPEGANLAAAKFYFTDGTDADRPDGNGWYQSQVGDTMVNVCDGTVGRGVPYARTYTGQHAGQTKVTVNFKPTDSVGERATGVRVWTDDQTKSTYLPFGATVNGFGKIAQGYVDGTQSQVRFRIVDDKTADEASAGTEDSYLARTWKLDKFANAYVDGAIEAWVDGSQPQSASDRSPEKAAPAATPQPNDIKNPKTLTVKLHYYRADGRYQDYDMESDTWKGWDLWSWYKESTSGVATPFNGHDDFGEVAEYTLSQTGKGVRDPWFIIRNGGSSWTGKDCDDNDRQIPESVINVQAGDLAAGTAEFWILSGDPTVYAHPVAATGVTFDSQGGSPIGAQTVKLGGTASEPVAPTKDGFKFVRWTTDVAGIHSYDFNSEVTAPVTLYAQWAVAHKVTFDSTGGSAVDTQLVGDGEKASAPANPTRTGYTFAGWRTDATGGAAYDFNATPVTVSQIRELGERLVDIHGQHAHQSLLKTSYQLQLVDGFGGTQPLRLAVREAWLEWQERVRLLNQATQNVEQQQAEAERLGWINELFDELDPREGQWEELSKEHSLLSNGAEIVSHIRAAADALSQGDVTAVGLTMQAQADLSAAAKFDPELAQYEESLSEASAILEDISRDLSHHLDRFNVDESRFAEIDERLSMYWKLSRKLHRAPEDLFAYRLEVKARLEELAENADIELLEENEKRAKEVFLKRAAALTQARMKAAQDLSKAVTDEMQHLSMTGGCLQITLPKCDPWAGGMERCEFLVSGHAGATPRPLTKVASGGELAAFRLPLP